MPRHESAPASRPPMTQEFAADELPVSSPSSYDVPVGDLLGGGVPADQRPDGSSERDPQPQPGQSWVPASIATGTSGGLSGFLTGLRPGQLRRRVMVAEAVAELSHQALSARRPEELLRQSLQVALEVVGADYGTAVRRLANGELRVAQELGPKPLPMGTILPLSAERSYVMRVIETGHPLVSPDLRNDPRIAPPGPLLDRGVVSGLAVPVRGAEEVMGVLAVHSRRQRRFTRDDVAAISALAGVVATAWEQAAHRETLGHQALHDPLTGLANRVLFMDRLELALARRPPREVGAYPADVAVMLIDVDGFKAINDSFGHGAGDQVLKATAHRLRGAVRPQDTIARLGGDEFGVLCDPVADEQTAVKLARRMQAACAQPLTVAGATLSVGVSFGITWSRRAADEHADPTALLGQAEAALYSAKERGGGGIRVYDARLQRSTRHRRQLEADLEGALERGEFRLYYQPVRRTSDLRPLGVETLLRWEHPTRGLLLPETFLATAQQVGLAVPIGDWVLGQACRDAARWQREHRAAHSGGQPELLPWLSVNLAAGQLNDPDLPATVAAAQREAGLAPGTLMLELTESALMPGDTHHREALAELHDAGARLALDDFGTGYSSLTHLAELPLQAVKIDSRFVAELPANRRKAAVVSSLITLGAELDLQVVAEGVETASQLAALQAMHCPAVQGFLLDEPRSEPSLVTIGT